MIVSEESNDTLTCKGTDLSCLFLSYSHPKATTDLLRYALDMLKQKECEEKEDIEEDKERRKNETKLALCLSSLLPVASALLLYLLCVFCNFLWCECPRWHRHRAALQVIWSVT